MKVISLLSALIIILFCSCHSKDCKYERLTNFSEEAKSKNGSSLSGALKIKANLRRLNATEAEINLVDSTFLELTEAVTKKEVNYDMEFLQAHNGAVQALCDLEQDLKNETDSIRKSILFDEKKQKRTEYFNFVLNYYSMKKEKNISKIIIEEEEDTPVSIRHPEFKEKKTSEDNTDYVNINPYKFGEEEIISLLRNGKPININNDGASVPIGLNYNDKIEITFSSGNKKMIIYNGSNL